MQRDGFHIYCYHFGTPWKAALHEVWNYALTFSSGGSKLVPRKVSAVRHHEMLCFEFPMVSVSVSSLSHSQRMLLSYCKGAKEVWGVRKPWATLENRLAFSLPVGEEKAANRDKQSTGLLMALSSDCANLIEALARCLQMMHRLDHCYNFNTGCSFKDWHKLCLHNGSVEMRLTEKRWDLMQNKGLINKAAFREHLVLWNAVLWQGRVLMIEQDGPRIIFWRCLTMWSSPLSLWHLLPWGSLQGRVRLTNVRLSTSQRLCNK